MSNIITVGTATTTGGKVLKGYSGVTLQGKPVALVGDLATCMCGLPICRKIGKIMALSPRAVFTNGVLYAKAGDFVNTGCGLCFLINSSNSVKLGSKIASSVHMGKNITLGNNVNINN